MSEWLYFNWKVENYVVYSRPTTVLGLDCTASNLARSVTVMAVLGRLKCYTTGINRRSQGDELAV